MEKKVAVVLLSVIALGFYISSLAFLIGNPFTTTEGSYRYSFSDVTVEVPLGWLDNLFKLANVRGLNLTTYDEKIIIHVGNSTTTVSGKNWEHYISRIVGPVIAFITQQGINNFAYSLRPVYTYEPKAISQPTVIIVRPDFLQDLLLGFVLGFGLLYAVGTKDGRTTSKEVLSALWKGVSWLRLRGRGKNGGKVSTSS